LSELPGTTIVRQWLGTIDAERFLNVTVPGLVGSTMARICTVKLPDTALYSGIIAPRSVGTTISRMTRKTAGYGFASTLALAGP